MKHKTKIAFFLFLVVIFGFGFFVSYYKKEIKNEKLFTQNLHADITNPVKYIPNEKTTLRFFIRNQQGQAIKSFENKSPILHLTIVDKLLHHFENDYPVLNFETGEFVLEDFVIPNEGAYRMYFQFTPKKSDEQVIMMDFATNTQINEADYVKNRQIVLTSDKINIDGYDVLVSSDKTFDFDFKITKDGKAVTLDPYFNEIADLKVFDKDLNFIKTKSKTIFTENNNGQIKFHSSFEKTGIHKMYLQFIVDKKLHTAEFAFDIKELDPNK